MSRLPRPQWSPDEQVTKFNACVGVGEEVEYKSFPGATPIRAKTTGAAFVLSGHTAVVFLENVRGCVAIDHCRVPGMISTPWVAR